MKSTKEKYVPSCLTVHLLSSFRARTVCFIFPKLIGNVWKQEGIDIDLCKLTVSQATYAFFKKAGLQTEPAGSSAYNDSNFYLSNIKGIDKGTVKVPTALLDAYKTRNNGNDLELDDKTGSGLGEFDYTSWSGWMITDDNVPCNTSAGAYLVDRGRLCQDHTAAFAGSDDLSVQRLLF